jgi:hypothetical protein
MIVKYFGMIIDHPRRQIIHGESGPIYEIESYHGVMADIYDTKHGYDAELAKAIGKFPSYALVDASNYSGHLQSLYEKQKVDVSRASRALSESVLRPRYYSKEIVFAKLFTRGRPGPVYVYIDHDNEEIVVHTRRDCKLVTNNDFTGLHIMTRQAWVEFENAGRFRDYYDYFMSSQFNHKLLFCDQC